MTRREEGRRAERGSERRSVLETGREPTPESVPRAKRGFVPEAAHDPVPESVSEATHESVPEANNTSARAPAPASPPRSMPNPPRIHLTVNGRDVEIADGSTVAAVLAVAGVGGARRSVSGEPRGVFCGMGVCQECRVTIDGGAHVLACQTLCRAGQSVLTDGGEVRR